MNVVHKPTNARLGLQPNEAYFVFNAFVLTLTLHRQSNSSTHVLKSIGESHKEDTVSVAKRPFQYRLAAYC